MSRKRFFATCCSSSVSKTTVRADFPASRASLKRMSTSYSSLACLSPPTRACFSTRLMRFSTVSRSLNCSSRSMISLSRTGFTEPSTCTILSLSKQRSTCMIASVSRMLPRNWFPRPSPLLAPFTSPAMSTISHVAGTMRSGCISSASLLSRSSGTVICPICASIVQKGKFAACAFALERQLKSVDFPTLGKPTIPALRAINIFNFNYILHFPPRR